MLFHMSWMKQGQVSERAPQRLRRSVPFAPWVSCNRMSRIDDILEQCQKLDDKRLQKIDAAAADAPQDDDEEQDDEASVCI